MAGPVLIIDLSGPVAAEQVAELGVVLRGLASRFVEARAGSYDVEVEPGRLGVVDPAGEGARPFIVSITGPGFGDEAVFRAEHSEDPDLQALIGFTPTHDVVVAGATFEVIDRLMIAELGAVVQDVVGGLADVGTPPRALDVVRSLPGVVAIAGEPRTRVFGTAEFLRAWAAHPEFRYYSRWAGRPPTYHQWENSPQQCKKTRSDDV